MITIILGLSAPPAGIWGAIVRQAKLPSCTLHEVATSKAKRSGSAVYLALRLGYVVLENPGMTTASGRLPWSLSWSMTKCATELDSSWVGSSITKRKRVIALTRSSGDRRRGIARSVLVFGSMTGGSSMLFENE